MLRRARLDPTPVGEARYRASLRFLRDTFAAWSEQGGAQFGPDSFEELIYCKWHHLDGHLTCWRRGDLEAILLELFPAKVIVEDDELDNVIEEAKTFVAFLAGTGLLDPASDDRDELCLHLDQIKVRFRRRMAERARYSPGKRFWLAALAAGVDIEDDEAIAAFVRQFNARPAIERAPVLGRASKPMLTSSSPRAMPPGTHPVPTRSRRRRQR